MFRDFDQVVEILTELGIQLDARGLEGEIYIVGGTAMMLGYTRNTLTNDIDGLFTPRDEIEVIADQMRSQFPRLTKGWLNNKVVPLLPRVKDSGAWQALKIPGLTVSVASPEHMLAMKARAGRSLRDLEDVAILVELLEITTFREVWDVCDSVWGLDVIRPEVKAEVEKYLAQRGVSEN